MLNMSWSCTLICFVFCFVVASLEAKLSFVIQPSDVVFAPKQSVMLNCKASDTLGRIISINWKQNDTWLTDPSNNPWQHLRNDSLYFQSISKLDAGGFLCGASIPGTSETIYSRIASVQAAYTSSIFSSSPANQTKRAGDASTYFTCVTGNSLPYANIYWEKDGNRLPLDSVVTQQLATAKDNVKQASSSLTIKDIKLSSAGFYTCVAVNSFQPSIIKKSEAGYLIVLPSQDKPHFKVHPTNLIAPENQPSTLQCLILGVPTPTITWKYNGQHLVPSASRQILSNGSLYFPSVNRTFTGQYRCKGSNDIGSIESSDVLLSVAFFEFQFQEQPASQNITMGTKLTLKCKPPLSYPVDVTINWFKNYQKITPISGITISSDGSLVFDSIKKSDEGEYFCNGENKVLQRARSSDIAVVTVWVPPTFTKPPTSTAVIQYSPLSLHCKATGFPQPSTSWLKDGGALDQSHVTLLPNGSLVIQRAEVKDAGNYSCYASNVAGKAASYAIVEIYVPPSVSTKPSDAVRVLGQSITFQCGFHGNPTPRIEWYHGNKSLFSPVPSTPKYNITGGTLSISSVSIEDEGTFLCKGTNVAGAANASAYLNVQVPVSLDAGPVNITVNQSSSASFKCVASGDPRPNITWYKKNQMLANGGRIVITDETLSITATTANDAGEYQCHVTNGLAKHVGKAYLVVQVPSTISSFQVPSLAPLASHVSMTCQSNGIPKPLVTWFKNDKAISGSRFTLFSNGSLRIMGIVKEDGGMYICVASNAAGVARRNGTLTIQVPPDAPLHLTALTQTSSSIKLSWQQGFNGHAPIISYKVDYKKDNDSVFKELASNHNGLEFIVHKLLPFTKYIFRISARNFVGLGKSVEAMNITLEDAPSEPQRVKLSALNSTAITITWSSPTNPNGIIRRYEITYQSLPSGSAIMQEVLGSTMMSLVTNLLPYTLYAVKIRAYTTLWGNYSQDVTQRTAEAAPESPPQSVVVHAVGPQSVFVSWKPVPGRSANGIVRKYQISYHAVTTSRNLITTVTVNSPASNYSIQKLSPWTFYNISVQAFTVDFGPGSEWKTVQTHEGVPSAAPNVTLTTPNESSILATITPPNVSKRNGIIIGYNVTYRPSNSLMSTSLFISSNHTAVVLLSNLNVYTFYTVSVAMATNAGVGPISDEMKIQTQEGVPSEVTISSISLSNEAPNTVVMKWSPPRPVRGAIIHYKITYNQSDGDLVSMTTQETSITLSSLQYNTTYQIWVVARTSKGYGMPGNVETITTGTKPTIPPTTGIPTTTPVITNSTEPVIKVTPGKNSGIFLSAQNVMIILICAGVVFLVLLILVIYCGCKRLRQDKKQDNMNSRKMRSLGLDAHELRGVSPDRRPVLDVHEEASANSADSFDDYSDFNSSMTGITSEQTGSEPFAKKLSQPSSESTGVHPLTHPVRHGSHPRKNSRPHFSKSHLSKLKSKKPSLGSNDSYYDQPYTTVDELGTGFSSFTPPPPEDFRNEESNQSSQSTPRDPPTEFSNQLFNATVYENPEEVKPQHILSEYAEPDVTFTPRKAIVEEEIRPEVFTPPPEAFMSDFGGVQNEGYNTDEELDNYLGKNENNPSEVDQSKPSNSSRSSSQTPGQSQSPTSMTSSRSHSASPPIYAVVDKSKKKKNMKTETEDDPADSIVYDDRTNF